MILVRVSSSAHFIFVRRVRVQDGWSVDATIGLMLIIFCRHVRENEYQALHITCGSGTSRSHFAAFSPIFFCRQHLKFRPSVLLLRILLQTPGAAKTFAVQLVEQSMLQPAGDAFRVHDLILRFLKSKLKADPGQAIAVSRMAEYLGQLKVLERYNSLGDTVGGVFSFIALWNSVEDLSDESHVAAVYTRNLQGITQASPWHTAGRVLHLMVSRRRQGSCTNCHATLSRALLKMVPP